MSMRMSVDWPPPVQLRQGDVAGHVAADHGAVDRVNGDRTDVAARTQVVQNHCGCARPDADGIHGHDTLTRGWPVDAQIVVCDVAASTVRWRIASVVSPEIVNVVGWALTVVSNSTS